MLHLYFSELILQYALNELFVKRSIKMKYKNKKIKKYFVYTLDTSFILLDFVEMKYTSSILLSLKINTLLSKSTSNILLSLNINT